MDQEIITCLKSSRICDRHRGINLLNDYLENLEESDEKFAEEFAQFLVSCIPYYHDRSSQYDVLHLISKAFLKFNKNFKPIIKFYYEYGKSVEGNSSYSKSVSKHYSFAVHCGVCIWKSCMQEQAILTEKEVVMLASTISIFFSISIHEDTKIKDRLLSSMNIIWKVEKDLKIFAKALLSNELDIHKLVTGGWILHAVKDSGNIITEEFNKSLINHYLSLVITSKKKPPLFNLVKTQALLNEIREKEFEELVLPAAIKSLLRNPEVTLEAVIYLIRNVNVDYSPHINEFIKVLKSPVHANEDIIREQSVKVCMHLMQKCRKPEAVQTFIEMLFSVLNGADGKLVINSHKISVLQAIENSCQKRIQRDALTGDVESPSLLHGNNKLVTDVCQKILKFMKTETHEGSLLQAINALCQWSLLFSNGVPECVTQFVTVKGISDANFSSSTRIAYCNCLCDNLSSANAATFLPIIPAVLKLIDKALIQPNNVSCLSEALYWTNFLLNIESVNGSASEKIESLWKTSLDLKKKYFTSEKFLSQATSEVLVKLVSLCQHMLGTHESKLNSEKSSYVNALCWCLSCSEPSVRQVAQSSAKKLCQSKALNAQLAENLIKYLPLAKTCSSEKDDSSESSSNGISHSGIMQALLTLVKTPNITVESRFRLAHCAIKIIYYPNVNVHDSERLLLWKMVCKFLQLKHQKFFESVKNEIFTNIKDNFEGTEITHRYLYGMFVHGAVYFYPELVNQIIEAIDVPEILDVTDEEYAIFQTQPDIVYNMKVIDEAFENELNLKNVKRSTKTYSHKEEVMMLEDKRKVLEEKRKAGKLDLTPKQKEVVKNQLEKESVVRKKVKQLYDGVYKGVFLLETAVAGNLKELRQYFKTIIPVIIKYFPSQLIGSNLSKIYLDMSKYVYNSKHKSLGELTARTTVLANKSNMEIPLDWIGENVNKAAWRAVTEISEICSEIDKGYYFDGSGLAYAYPLFEWTFFKYQDENEDTWNATMCNVLHILKIHIAMRGAADSLEHPQFFPRTPLMNILIKIISTRTGVIHERASSILEDLCESASGKKGCDKINPDEIKLLIETLKAPSPGVRYPALKGLAVVVRSMSTLSLKNEMVKEITLCLWIANHDVFESISDLSNELWEENKMKCAKNMLEGILMDITHSTEDVRKAAALALADFAKVLSHSIDDLVGKLIKIYRRKLTLTPAKEDQYGHIIAEAIDHWEGRSGVAIAIKCLADQLEEKSVQNLAKFFVPEACNDRNEVVQKDMLSAALSVINCHGKEHVGNLFPVFEKFLSTSPKNAKYDTIRQAVVILMGSLAKHLEPTDPKVKPIVMKLIDALSTPSQQVQEAVANCLHPLVPAVKDECPKLIEKMLHILLETSNFGQRKGAAYGLASLVKGLGILSLKQLNIMNKITSAIQDKKVNRYREGALFAVEQLCLMLGKLFEPYIVYILPHLLICFGDGNQYVRKAADETAKAVMSKLSAHGVKLVLPSLLAALEEDSWRTKAGSIELLGNMAYCAPKQLSSCLPSIVPHLIEVLSDSHQNVQQAGEEALKLIGSVIRNPEIQAIVPVLLKSLQNPHTISNCLQTLLETKFIHFIDAPSLALIMPVVERAFQDRSTEVRKMAAQIIGNMYSLTDQKDLQPYLPSITPGLKTSLLDPVPKVRTISARALGAMVRGMGEKSFDDLLPWLMQTLTSEASPVDRSGAAQGLAEVVGGLGAEKLHKLMPDIIATSERQDIAPHVKDGYIMMFIFLPTVFEKEFTQYIGYIISPILKALADENEYVRDTALRAGQRIVNTYAETAVTLLLPELENGLFDDNWRIRYSSVQLLGDLLYRVSGVTGKMTTDTAHEDDNFGTEHSQTAIMKSLGAERRNRVLAGLYMGRSDLALMVRQSALHVWKVVVTNTPKTLREILPTLFTLLLSCLASTSRDKRQVAARTLGDLVRKLGERVLPEIIPILEAGLDAEDPDHRQGVCIGLSEIMASTSRDMILLYAENLVPTVRRALCDPLQEVREAAAVTFDTLHSNIGSRALDDILKPLLALVQESSDEYALDGLKRVMTRKSKVVLPYLIPQLTAPPVNTEALCILASVAGESLSRHLPKILPALIDSMKPDMNPNAMNQCQEVILAVNDVAGISIIVDELIRTSKNKDVETARASVFLLSTFSTNSKADFVDFIPDLIRGFIYLATSDDTNVLQTAANGLLAVTKKLDPADQRAMVNEIRQAIKFAASDLKDPNRMPGFCMPKGVQPILPFYREALLNGEPEQKEAACIGLAELIKLTSADSLKTSVIHITGPLIRILGDRFTWNVKVAVLDTLALLLEKTGNMLKPFLPQLQTTFVKSIYDPHRAVRLKAGIALSFLVPIHTKPDPMFAELAQALKTSEDTLVRETTLQAVRHVVIPAGNKLSESSMKAFTSCVTSLLFNNCDSVRLCAAGALGALFKWLPQNEAQSIAQNYILDDNNSDHTVRHGKCAALFAVLKLAPAELFEACADVKIAKSILSYLTSDQTIVMQSAVVAAGYYLFHQIQNNIDISQPIASAFAKSVNNVSNEVKEYMCRLCQYTAQRIYEDNLTLPKNFLVYIVPNLVLATKEKNPVVRSSGEMALIAILKMQDGKSPSEVILNCLDTGARNALMDTINRNLKKANCIPLADHEADPSLIS